MSRTAATTIAGPPELYTRQRPLRVPRRRARKPMPRPPRCKWCDTSWVCYLPCQHHLVMCGANHDYDPKRDYVKYVPKPRWEW